MDIERMKPAERVALCRKYFFIGIAGLPFLWLVNAIWFGHFAYVKKGVTSKERARIKEAAQAAAQAAQEGQPQTSSIRGSSHRHRYRDDEHGGALGAPPPPAPFVDPTTDEERLRGLATIRRYVLMSAAGALLWAIGITTWVVIFQVNRVAWDEWGDQISFNIPRGIP